MNDLLVGKRIVITGASSGVGRAVSEALAPTGARQFIMARREASLSKHAKLLRKKGVEVWSGFVDVADYSQVDAAFTKAEEYLGGIDVLIHCAALPGDSVLTMQPKQWRKIIETNLLGCIYANARAVQSMKSGGIPGQIITIGSLAIRMKDKGADLYVASKTGVDGFTASLRKEVADDSITVTLINPGQIASGMVKESEEELAEMVAEEDMLTPDDVAQAILWCLSRPSRVAVTEMELRPRGQLYL